MTYEQVAKTLADAAEIIEEAFYELTEEVERVKKAVEDAVVDAMWKMLQRIWSMELFEIPPKDLTHRWTKPARRIFPMARRTC